VATSVAAGLAGTATASLSVSLVVGRQLLHRPSVPAHLALPVGGQHYMIAPVVTSSLRTSIPRGPKRIAYRVGHFIFPFGKYLRHRRFLVNLRRRKDSSLRLRLDEVHLQERLEVQVRHLILVRNAQELRERRVGQDAALERRVEAVVLLDVARDELRHLRLRALLARLQAHERAELIRERALNQEGVVRAAGLPRLALLRSHVLRVLLLLLLDLASLALGRLDGIGNALRGLTDLRRQVGTETLEVLGQAGEEDIGALNRLNNGGGRRGLNRRHGHNRLRGGGGLRGLDLRGLGCSGDGGRGRGRRGGLGILLGGHL